MIVITVSLQDKSHTLSSGMSAAELKKYALEHKDDFKPVKNTNAKPGKKIFTPQPVPKIDAAAKPQRQISAAAMAPAPPRGRSGSNNGIMVFPPKSAAAMLPPTNSEGDGPRANTVEPQLSGPQTLQGPPSSGPPPPLASFKPPPKKGPPITPPKSAPPPSGPPSGPPGGAPGGGPPAEAIRTPSGPTSTPSSGLPMSGAPSSGLPSPATSSRPPITPPKCAPLKSWPSGPPSSGPPGIPPGGAPAMRTPSDPPSTPLATSGRPPPSKAASHKAIKTSSNGPDTTSPDPPNSPPPLKGYFTEEPFASEGDYESMAHPMLGELTEKVAGLEASIISLRADNEAAQAANKALCEMNRKLIDLLTEEIDEEKKGRSELAIALGRLKTKVATIS